MHACMCLTSGHMTFLVANRIIKTKPYPIVAGAALQGALARMHAYP